jgi:hypothetical protein
MRNINDSFMMHFAATFGGFFYCIFSVKRFLLYDKKATPSEAR